MLFDLTENFLKRFRRFFKDLGGFDQRCKVGLCLFITGGIMIVELLQKGWAVFGFRA